MSSLFQRAADDVACRVLADVAASSTAYGVWAAWSGAGAIAPLTVGGLSYMANYFLCQEMDFPDNPNDSRLDGCIKGSNPDGYPLQYDRNGQGLWGNSALGMVEIVSVGEVYEKNGKWGHRLECITKNGLTTYVQGGLYDTETEAIEFGKYRLNIPENECEKESSPDTPGNPYPDFPEYDYTDPETNCNYTLKLEGWVQTSPGGPALPAFRMSGGSTGTRAGGGRMGGCNLSPTIFIHNYDGSGGGGGGPNIPVPSPQPPDPDGQPWWLGPMIGALATTLLNQLLNQLTDTNQTPMAAGSFTLTAPCNVDAEGNPSKSTWNFDAQPWYQRIHDQQLVIMEILQQHLDWKTPICESDPIIPEGDFRTISFRSDETSPYGKSRLRKRLRYRSVSGNDLSAVVDHWKDFSFEGGPYRVRWTGGTWGTVEVWAASEAEGKRVIQHAAAEAGFDPFENGRWSTRVSGSPRLGVRGTVRIDTTGGYYWITARDGSDQRPIVATTPPHQ